MSAGWVTLESIIQTSDLTHVKQYSGWDYNNFYQWLGTDWNLSRLCEDGNNNKINKVDDEYRIVPASSSNSYRAMDFSFVLKKNYYIKGIKFDGKFLEQRTSDSNYQMQVRGCKMTNNAWNNQLMISVAMYTSLPTDIDYSVTDTNWNTFEKMLNSPVECNYVMLYQGHWSGAAFKNIYLYIEDLEVSNGGGATHIAKRTGQLKDLSSYTSDILIVSGGGGGGLLVGETSYTGKEAGGISGSGDNSADQTTGNAFGLGESGTNLSGGGSGLYGGYKGTSAKSGGAGSGYIGNSLLSNKKMVGYNVPTSSATDTKTESVEVYDSNYVANKPKAGNGHARIRVLSEVKSGNFFDLVSDYNLDVSNLVDVGTSNSDPWGLMVTAFNNPQNRNKIIYGGQSYRNLPVIEDGKIKYTSHRRNDYVGTYLAFPLKQDIIFYGISAKATITNSPKGNWEMHRLIDTTDDNPIELRFVYNWPDETRNINLNQETELSSHVGEYYNAKATHIVLEWGYGTWESRDIIITYFV